MVDLLLLTKDYYSKSEMEKEHIKSLIYADMIQLTILEELNYIQLKDVIEVLKKNMIKSEDYEIADILQNVFREVEINYYKINQNGL
jgi:hypothetical protein